MQRALLNAIGETTPCAITVLSPLKSRLLATARGKGLEVGPRPRFAQADTPFRLEVAYEPSDLLRGQDTELRWSLVSAVCAGSADYKLEDLVSKQAWERASSEATHKAMVAALKQHHQDTSPSGSGRGGGGAQAKLMDKLAEATEEDARLMCEEAGISPTETFEGRDGVLKGGLRSSKDDGFLFPGPSKAPPNPYSAHA